MLEVTPENTAKAIERAKQTKLLVKVIQFRIYAVRNRETGAQYTVNFYKVGGRRFSECDCKAGQTAKHQCKHVGASIGLHIVLAEQIQTTKL